MAKRRQSKSDWWKRFRRKEPGRKRRDGHWVGRVLRWSVVTAIWSVVILAALLAWFAYDLPDIEQLQHQTRQPQVTVLAVDGSVIARGGAVYGRPVRIEDVPPYLVQAIVAVEDRRFFEHSGIDPVAVLRAAWTNLRYGEIRQGGSTLTQQLAKNLFLDSSRTLRRKVQELLIALWLEARFDKRAIFTIYINRVYMGSGAYGVEAAARHYFGVPPRDVTLHEAAVLAGLLKAPSRYAPSHNPDGALRRANVVLNTMVDAGFLKPDDARRAERQKLRLVGNAETGAERYFTDWVLQRVSGYAGGGGRDLVVRTTLDTRLQAAADKRLSALLDKRGKASNVSQGALVAMSPDGAIRALIGGRDYHESQFNRATQSLRQPGSAFKLFVYLAAVESGMTPDDTVVDAPVMIDKWQPRNFERDYRGAITLRQAFASSVNTVSVQISERIGRDKVVAAARRLGITAPIKNHPSLALGTSELSLMELTAAYATLPNGGWGVWPHAITEIADTDGNVVYRRTGSGPPQVIERGPLNAANDLLSTVVADGTGRRAALRTPAAGKTGTSQDFRDAWFVGYAGGLVAGVWLGNDDDSPMKRVTGGTLPAELWRDFMTDALKESGSASPPTAAPDIPSAISLLPAMIDRVLRQRRERLADEPDRTAPARTEPADSGLQNSGRGGRWTQPEESSVYRD